MFALMSYEGYKGRTAPDSINNYSAYKIMKADAGYGMASADENSFVNKKVNADYLLEQIYDSLKKRETEQEAKSFDVCEYLLQMIKIVKSSNFQCRSIIIVWNVLLGSSK